MGKASSNKKVARAAGIGGGRTYRRNTPWGYFAIVIAIVVLGLAGTWVSRNDRINAINNAGKTQAPAVGQSPPWSEGYAVYECGSFVKPISSTKNPQGIHTSSPGNGIITIAPTVDAAAGKNATLGKFASAVGMTLNAAELQVPGGKLWQDGDTCEGGPGHVYIKHFAFPGATGGQLYNGNTKKCNPGQTGTGCGQLARLDPQSVPLGDQEMLTIAFVPKNDEGSIPPPPASVVAALNKLAASSSTTTTTPATPTTTTPRTTTTKPKTTTTK
jgi:hypothetical protein